MAKYLELQNGNAREAVPISQSSGAGDANRIVQTGSDGRLDQTLMPAGIGADTTVVQASENLAAGDQVNIWSDAGDAQVRKADASSAGKESDGFVREAVDSGDSAQIYRTGTVSGLSGLVAGARYFLSADMAGGVTSSAPSGSGQVVQGVGKAISESELAFERGLPVIRG
jgi:hypothetical protein